MKASRSGPGVSHNFFADDFLLFGEASTKQTYAMDKILPRFCAMSGQSVSLSKSHFLSKNTSPDVAAMLSDALKMKGTTDLGRYLGIPVLYNRVTTRTYEFLVDKIWSRLSHWKAKVLSQDACAILIKFVLTTLPTYVMQTSRIPGGTLDSVEKHIHKFFWNELDGSKRLHYLPWDVICTSKEMGRLGIKKLRQMNTSFLMKLCWSM